MAAGIQDGALLPLAGFSSHVIILPLDLLTQCSHFVAALPVPLSLVNSLHDMRKAKNCCNLQPQYTRHLIIKWRAGAGRMESWVNSSPGWTPQEEPIQQLHLRLTAKRFERQRETGLKAPPPTPRQTWHCTKNLLNGVSTWDALFDWGKRYKEVHWWRCGRSFTVFSTCSAFVACGSQSFMNRWIDFRWYGDLLSSLPALSQEPKGVLFSFVLLKERGLQTADVRGVKKHEAWGGALWHLI